MTRAHQPTPKQETKTTESAVRKDAAARSSLFSSSRETTVEGISRGAAQSGCHFGAVSILPPVQRKSLGALTDLSPAEVQSTAARATRGPGGPLPFLSRLQHAFGPHDLSGIRAHQDGQAASAAVDIGARAFAQGDHVAFGETPTLHDVAHEAAHVIQQRGGARPEGGVDRAGDSLEQHADRVAAAVVSGRSAAPLLEHIPQNGGAGLGSAVQRIPDEQTIKKKLAKLTPRKVGDYLVKLLSPSDVSESSAEQILKCFLDNAKIDLAPHLYYPQYWAQAQEKNKLLGDFPKALCQGQGNKEVNIDVAKANQGLTRKSNVRNIANVVHYGGKLVSAPSDLIDKGSDMIEKGGTEIFNFAKTQTLSIMQSNQKGKIKDDDYDSDEEEYSSKKKKKKDKESKNDNFNQSIKNNQDANWETFDDKNKSDDDDFGSNFDLAFKSDLNDDSSKKKKNVNNNNNNNDLFDDEDALPHFFGSMQKHDDDSNEAFISDYASNEKVAKIAAKSLGVKVWSYVAKTPAYMLKKLGTALYGIIDSASRVLTRLADCTDAKAMKTQVNAYYEEIRGLELKHNQKLYNPQCEKNLILVIDTLAKSRLFTLASSAVSAASSGVDSDSLNKTDNFGKGFGLNGSDAYGGAAENESELKKNEFGRVLKQHQTLKKGVAFVQKQKEKVGLSSKDKDFVANQLDDIRTSPFESDRLVATMIITQILRLDADASSNEIRDSI